MHSQLTLVILVRVVALLVTRFGLRSSHFLPVVGIHVHAKGHLVVQAVFLKKTLEVQENHVLVCVLCCHSLCEPSSDVV